MSIIHDAIPQEPRTARGARHFLLDRVLLAAVACMLVGSGLFLLCWMIFGGSAPSTAATANPFGLPNTPRGVSAGQIGVAIAAMQAQFYAALTASVHALKVADSTIFPLAAVGFLYGVFHAAGPGHGKGVISAYMFAAGRKVSQGYALSFGAALLQGTMAVVIVTIAAVVLNISARAIDLASHALEIVSFAGLAGFGALLVWWKAGELAQHLGNNNGEGNEAQPAIKPGLLGACTVILAAGIRPCSGAIILLVFSLSQGMFLAGVAGAYAMAVGTAITTGTLAGAAVFTRNTLRKLTSKNRRMGELGMASFELLAAAFVMLVGGLLLLGSTAMPLPAILD